MQSGSPPGATTLRLGAYASTMRLPRSTSNRCRCCSGLDPSIVVKRACADGDHARQRARIVQSSGDFALIGIAGRRHDGHARQIASSTALNSTVSNTGEPMLKLMTSAPLAMASVMACASSPVLAPMFPIISIVSLQY